MHLTSSSIYNVHMRYVNLVIGIVAKCFPFSIEKPTKTQHQHDIQHVRKLTKKVTYLKGLNASWVTKKKYMLLDQKYRLLHVIYIFIAHVMSN